MIELDDRIQAESGSGLCALCENAVEAWESHQVVVAHGGKYLCHEDCVTRVLEEDEEDE